MKPEQVFAPFLGEDTAFSVLRFSQVRPWSRIWKKRGEGEREKGWGWFSVPTAPTAWKRETVERPYPCRLDLLTTCVDSSHLNSSQWNGLKLDWHCHYSSPWGGKGLWHFVQCEGDLRTGVLEPYLDVNRWRTMDYRGSWTPSSRG